MGVQAMMRLCCPKCGAMTPLLPLSGRVPLSCASCDVEMTLLDVAPDATREHVPAAIGGPCVCDHAAGRHLLASDRDDDSYTAYECQADGCECLSYLDATAHDPEPPDVDPALLDDGDPIEVFAFVGWRHALFHRDHRGAAYVEIDMDDGPIRLRADNAIVQRIRRRWQA